MTTNPNPADPLDPHGLASSGEPLATPKELARLLGLSRSELETLLHRELAGRVRFVRTPPGGGKWRYSIEDAKAAIVPLLPALDEARKRRVELQAKDQTEAEKRKAERQAAHAAHVARKNAGGQRGRRAPARPGSGDPDAASNPPTSSRRHPPARVSERRETRPTPEVFVRRRFGEE